MPADARGEVRLTAGSLAAATDEVAAVLAHAGVASPASDARWLVEAAAGADPLRAPDAALTDEAREVLAELVGRRAAREPLQLVLGRTQFRTVELVCRPGVFIPRPETEVVAGLAVDAARAAAVSGATPVLVAEPCTGTGAITCSLVAEVADVRVAASDASPAAVALARHNLARLAHGEAGPPGAAAASTASVRRGDLLSPLERALRGRLDVLVANPPYLPAADRHGWEPEVAAHDPADALVGGEDGHEVVDRLLRLATRWLRPSGTVVVEIDERRAEAALVAADAAGLADARIVPDLAGAPRALVARRAPAH